MKTTKKKDHRTVQCQIIACGEPFLFVSPEQLVQLEGDNSEQYAFICDGCRRKYQDFIEEDDQWQGA